MCLSATRETAILEEWGGGVRVLYYEISSTVIFRNDYLSNSKAFQDGNGNGHCSEN